MNTLHLHKWALLFAGTGLLCACGNIRLQSPEELGKEVVNTVYRRQSQQQCASGGDPYAQLACERQARQQMQQYRKDQPKTANE